MKLSHELANEMFSQLPIDVKRNIISITTVLKDDLERNKKWPVKNLRLQSANVSDEMDKLRNSISFYRRTQKQFYSMHHAAIALCAKTIRFIIELPKKVMIDEEPDNEPTYQNGKRPMNVEFVG